MKKKNGFTLTEALTIIVIMGIIAAITVPITLNVINGAKKKAFKATAEGIVKSAVAFYSQNEDELGTFFVDENSLSFYFSGSEGKYGETRVELDGELKNLKYEGKKPIGGEVVLHKNGGIELINLTDGTYYANKDVDTEVTLSGDSTTLTREELTKIVIELQNQNKSFEEEIEVLKNKDKNLTSADNELTKELENQAEQIQTNKDDITVNKVNISTNTTNIETNTKNIATHTTQINNLITQINTINTGLLNKTYPVGSIYISTSSTNPSTLFGGTWVAYGTGRTLVGINTSDTNFNTVGKTGGASTINLSHSHTVNSHTHTINAHSHTVNSHTHTINAHSHTVNSHTHTINAHSHTVNSHYHTTAAHTLTTNEIPSHSHSMYGYADGANDISTTAGYYARYIWSNSRTNITPTTHWVGGGKAHSHGNTGSSSPGTNSVSLTTNGATSGTNAVSLTTNGTAPGTNSVSLTTNGTAPGTNAQLSSSQSILQPYITVYMWRRTA